VAHCQCAGLLVDRLSCVTRSRSMYCRVPVAQYPFTCRYSYHKKGMICREQTGGCDVAGLLTSWKDRAHTKLDDMCGVIDHSTQSLTATISTHQGATKDLMAPLPCLLLHCATRCFADCQCCCFLTARSSWHRHISDSSGL